MANYRTKWCPELQEKFCALVREGQFFKTTCGLCGIGYDTFRDWMNRGAKEGEGIYFEFMKAVHAAEAEAEAEANKKWQLHFHTDYKSIRDWMDRRFANRWSRKDRMEISGPNGGPLQTQELSNLSVEELQQLASLLKKAEDNDDEDDESGVETE